MSPGAAGVADGGGRAAPEDGRLGRLKVLAAVVLLTGVVADLATKAWMERLLAMDPNRRGPPVRRIEVIPGFFALEESWNTGVTFGLAPGQTTAILVFTLGATLALALWAALTRRPSRLLHVALAMVLGGALGNLYDRLRWEKVRDFFLFYVGRYEWPNFNVADSLIVVGVGLIVWDELFRAGRAARGPAAAPA